MFGRADTFLFLRMVTAPHSNVKVLPVSCPVSVLDRRDTKERKRERDKAEHVQLCEPHFVHAIVDDSTDMSDLGPTKDTENIEFKVRRADNMKHKFERCAEGSMTHGRMRHGERGRTHKMADKSTGFGVDRNPQVKAWSNCLTGGRDSNSCYHSGGAGAEWHRICECKGWADLRAQIDEGVFQVPSSSNMVNSTIMTSESGKEDW